MGRPATSRELTTLVLLATAIVVAAFAIQWARASDGSWWDVPLYERYGDRMADGEVPYRDFRVEYPPGALPLFLLPALASQQWGPEGESEYTGELNAPARSYALWFAAAMLLAFAGALVATALCLGPLETPRAEAALALGLVAATPLLLGSLASTRFDAVPVALAALAVALALRRRPAWSGLALGLAVGVKLYPALLLPLLAIHLWKAMGRRAAVTSAAVAAATAALVFVPFVVLAGAEALFPLRVQLGRGLQVESLAGSVAVALDVVSGRPVPIEEGSYDLAGKEVAGLTGAILSAASSLVLVALIVVVCVLLIRGSRDARALVVAAAALLTAQLAFGRVLSPQFLLWTAPFVPLAFLRARNRVVGLGLYAMLLATTNVWFPKIYVRYIAGDGAATAFLVLRNGLLVALAVLLLLVLRQAGERDLSQRFRATT